MKSKQKGKRGELEVARILREHGYADARRGQQYAGSPDSHDVVGGPTGFNLEVKRRENLNIDEALEQSTRDAAPDEIPTVVHRKNDKEWKITMYFEDFLKLINE